MATPFFSSPVLIMRVGSWSDGRRVEQGADAHTGEVRLTISVDRSRPTLRSWSCAQARSRLRRLRVRRRRAVPGSGPGIRSERSRRGPGAPSDSSTAGDSRRGVLRRIAQITTPMIDARCAISGSEQGRDEDRADEVEEVVEREGVADRDGSSIDSGSMGARLPGAASAVSPRRRGPRAGNGSAARRARPRRRAATRSSIRTPVSPSR